MGIFESKHSRSVEYYNSDWPPAIVSDRQDSSVLPLNFSSSLTLATIGAAVVAANVFLLFALKPYRPKLENDWMCGLTTGGEVAYISLLFLDQANNYRRSATLTV